MKSNMKKVLSFLLTVCMLVTMVPSTAFAFEAADVFSDFEEDIELPQEASDAAAVEVPAADVNDETDISEENEDVDAFLGASEENEDTDVFSSTSEEDEEPAVFSDTSEDELTAFSDGETEKEKEDNLAIIEATRGARDLSGDGFYKIVHLDAGRKYFTKDWVINLINTMAENGYTHLELAVGNDGLRFLLDDMAVTVGETTYSSEEVKAGIQAGNRAYHDFGTNEWTETDMNAIIEAADKAGISIIPLINTPGHMDAIINAMKAVGISDAAFTAEGYGTSSKTVDVRNQAAVSFVQALLNKYIQYFAGKGCQIFNIGTDEYANDILEKYAGMGFGYLQDKGLYGKFATYVNNLATLVINAGMTPMAFNDGIYFNSDTQNNFNSNILISYWSSGWGTYRVAPANVLAGQGHRLVNTNGDFYYVLGKNDNFDNGASYANKWDNKVFMGYTFPEEQAGSMFCIWCDYPGAETEDEIAEKVMSDNSNILKAMSNAMGHNPEKTVTITDKKSGISVTASGLNKVECEASNTEVKIEGANHTLAYDIKPVDANGYYTGAATVSIPVPKGWNTDKMGAFVVETDGKVTLLTGKYADGVYTYTAPHFSVQGIYDKISTNVSENPTEKSISLTIGHEATDTLVGDYSNDVGKFSNSDIAAINVETETVSGEYWELVTNGADGIAENQEYIIANANTGTVSALTKDGGTSTEISVSDGKITSNVGSECAFTFVKNGNGWSIKDNAGKYLYPQANLNWKLNLDYSISNQQSSAEAVSITGNNAVKLARVINTSLFGKTTSYISYKNGYYADSNGSNLYLFKKVTLPAGTNTKVTFTGLKKGTTSVKVGPTTYAINVDYNKENVSLIKDSTITVTQTSSISGNPTYDKEGIVEATVSGETVTFRGLALGTAVVTVGDTQYTVTVIEEDLTKVTPLTVEYWITNGHATDANGGTTISIEATDEGVHSEEGIDITSIVPETAYRKGRSLKYWHTTVLDTTKTNSSTDGSERQSETNGDDETMSGNTFSKIRYWNGTWQVFTAESQWISVNLVTNQIVAYYMEKINIANEVEVLASDWGKKGDGTFSSDYLDPASAVTVSVQIVYEDGTTNPGGTSADDLKSKTIVYGYWSEGRGIGTMIFNNTAGFDIWKVTAETGAMTGNGSTWGSYEVSKFNWDKNEKIVWEGEATDSVSIHNTARNPVRTSPYDNLMWDENYESILLRVYVKTAETEDALSVHYIDQTVNTEFYNYNIAVAGGTTFNESFGLNNGVLTNNTVENKMGVIQTVSTDLGTMPEIGVQYRYSKYECVDATRSDDGKDVYLYYKFDNTHHFVIDFGLPLTITKGDLGIEGNWTFVSAEGAKYGTTTAESDGGVKYTPTKVLSGIESFTVTLTDSDNNNDSVSYQIYIYPASTVYYEEGFATSSGFTGGSKGTENQTTSAVGSGARYGFDDKYINDAASSNGSYSTSSKKGSTATFTFTGTGVDIYANCTTATGIVKVKNASDDLVKVMLVNTVLNPGESPETQLPVTTAYNVPITSIKDLEYGSYTITITLFEDSEFNLDGFRVYNTIIGNAANAIYAQDGEANPRFIELRNAVLEALIGNKTIDNIYADQIAKNIMSQVYAKGENTDGVTALILNPISQGSEIDVKDLLENGPKNEIYLYPNQRLVFNITGTGNAQIGLKALNGSASCTINQDSYSLNTNTDMFYPINNGEVTITNTGSNILSITKLKLLGGAVTTSLNEEILTTALLSMGYKQSPAPTVAPTETPTPTVEPTKAPVVTAPAAVTLKKLTAAGLTGAKLTWSKVKNADGYLIYRKTGSGSWKNIAAVKSTASSYTDSKLTAGKSYTYTVRAYKKVNGKAYKGDYDKKGLTINLVPKTPVLKKLSKASGSSLKLTWGKAANADGYVIYRKVSGSNKWEKVATIKKGSTVSYTDKNLKSGKTYTYTVRAYKTVNGKNIYSSYDKNGIKTKLK